MVENDELINVISSIGLDGKERPRIVTRPAPTPELPLVSIPVAKPDQVIKVAAKAQTVIDRAAPETVSRHQLSNAL